MNINIKKMKNLKIIVLLLLGFVLSCSQNEEDLLLDQQNQIKAKTDFVSEEDSSSEESQSFNYRTNSKLNKNKIENQNYSARPGGDFQHIDDDPNHNPIDLFTYSKILIVYKSDVTEAEKQHIRDTLGMEWHLVSWEQCPADPNSEVWTTRYISEDDFNDARNGDSDDGDDGIGEMYYERSCY